MVSTPPGERKGHRPHISNLFVGEQTGESDGASRTGDSGDISKNYPSSEIMSGSMSRLDIPQKNILVERKYGPLDSLDLDKPFPSGRPRQFYCVFMKNLQLQLHAWPSLIAIFTIVIILICCLGICYETSDSDKAPGYSTYSDSSLSGGISPNFAYLGSGLTWINQGTSENSERTYRDEFGVCTRTTFNCTGMIEKIDLPRTYAGYNQELQTDQLSMRYITAMEDGSHRFYPSFEHIPELDNIEQIEEALEYSNNIIFDQVSNHKNGGGVFSEDKFDDIYGFTLLINQIDNAASISYTDRMNVRHKYLNTLDYIVQVPQASLELYGLQPYAILNTIQNMLSSAMFRYNLDDQVGDETKLNKALEYMTVNTQWGNIPSYNFHSADDYLSEKLGTFVIPLIFLCVSTLFISSISYERGNQLSALQEMLGLTTMNKVLGFFVFQLCFEFIIGIIFIVLGYAFGIRFVFNTNPLYLFLVIIQASVVIPATSYFVSAFFDSQRLSLIISIVLLIFEIFLFLIVGGSERVSQDDALDPYDVTNTLWWNVWPTFGLLAGISEISNSVMSADIHPLDSPNYPFSNPYDEEERMRFEVARSTRIVEDFLISLPVSLLWMILGIYIENVLPKRYGMNKPLLYPFSNIVRRAWQIEKEMKKDKDKEMNGSLSSVESDSSDQVEESMALLGENSKKKAQKRKEKVQISSNNEMDLLGELNKSNIEGNEGNEELKEEEEEEEDKSILETYNTNLSCKRVFHSLKVYFSHFKEIKAIKKEEKKYRELIFSGNEEGLNINNNNTNNNNNCPPSTVVVYNNKNTTDQRCGDEDKSHSLEDEMNKDDDELKIYNVFEDSDVAREKHYALKNVSPIGRHVLVNVQNLRKVYKSKHKGIADKLAVDELYFTISDSECLGMLGPNGAGKTTTVSMLTGLYAPTSGTAFLCGYDILDPGTRILIQHQIGICPQFDIVWGSMTVVEHLRFYARLKGIPKKYEYQHVKDLLEAVGLTVKMNVPASALSGGMLRRLSVAIALAGRPKILILDEPTTGLDPSARRSLWNIILSSRKRRAILLTTHSMEEAESLCSRVGVMSAGMLRCIGTHTHLKSKYGSGVRITVTVWSPRIDEKGGFEQRKKSKVVDGVLLETENEVIVHEKLLSIIGEDLMLESAYCGQLTYNIVGKAEGSAVGLQFRTMEQLASDPSLHILDWGVSQTSLESAFMNIVDQVQADRK